MCQVLAGLELTKFASRPFGNTSWCWTGSTSWKIFPWTRNSFFLLALNTNPRRQEAAGRPLKSKHFEILLKSMPEPQSDECYFLLLELWKLCYALMNSIVPYTNQVLPFPEQLTPWTRDRVKLLQSPYFFRPLTPTFFNPITPTELGAFGTLPSFAKMEACRTQRLTSMISWENRGLWTVYIQLRNLYR